VNTNDSTETINGVDHSSTEFEIKHVNEEVTFTVDNNGGTSILHADRNVEHAVSTVADMSDANYTLASGYERYHVTSGALSADRQLRLPTNADDNDEITVVVNTAGEDTNSVLIRQSDGSVLSSETIVAAATTAVVKLVMMDATASPQTWAHVTTTFVDDVGIEISSGALQLKDGGVVAAKLGSGAVTTAKLGADAVDGTKLADNAVDSEHITANAVDAAHLNTAMDLATAGVTLSVAAPSADAHAATKKYVDDNIEGLDAKQSVRVVATTDGTLATAYENGDTVDGVVIATGERILLAGQTDASENGIHTVNASGAPTRAADMLATSGAANAFVFVEEGTTNADTGWVCTSNSGSDVVGTDNLAFSQYSTQGTIVAGAGMTKSGTTLNVIAGDATIVANADDVVAGVMQSANLASGSVTTAKLGADAVDGTKIADNAVDSEHITAGAIDAAHLASSAVTTAKINADAVDGTKIADDAVDSEHITAGAIDAAHLSNSTENWSTIPSSTGTAATLPNTGEVVRHVVVDDNDLSGAATITLPTPVLGKVLYVVIDNNEDTYAVSYAGANIKGAATTVAALQNGYAHFVGLDSNWWLHISSGSLA